MQIFYDPSNGQVMAFYVDCSYGGTAWQERGFHEAKAPEIMPRSRDLRVTVVDGVVTGWEPSPNPEQPSVVAGEPSMAEILHEAGVDIQAARKRLLEARRPRREFAA